MSTLRNTKIVKRKNNSHESKAEPPKKTLKKNELLMEYKALQQKNEALEEVNKVLLQEKKELLEANCLLEETIQLLEKSLSSSKMEKKSITSQTEIMRCEECEYPADALHDLVDHMHEFHPMESLEQLIKCHHCEQKFQTKNDLMNHRKLVHTDKVHPCIYFSEGKCDRGDLCWYSHDKTKLLTEYKCSICEHKFKLKSSLMNHRKKEHRIDVPMCRAEQNDSCKHGSENCCFNHMNENRETANGNIDDTNLVIR